MKKKSFWTPTHVILILMLLLDLFGPFLVKEPAHPVSLVAVTAAIATAYWTSRQPEPRRNLTRLILFVAGLLILAGSLLLPRYLVEQVGMILAGLSFLNDARPDDENR